MAYGWNPVPSRPWRAVPPPSVQPLHSSSEGVRFDAVLSNGATRPAAGQWCPAGQGLAGHDLGDRTGKPDRLQRNAHPCRVSLHADCSKRHRARCGSHAIRPDHSTGCFDRDSNAPVGGPHAPRTAAGPAGYAIPPGRHDQGASSLTAGNRRASHGCTSRIARSLLRPARPRPTGRRGACRRKAARSGTPCNRVVAATDRRRIGRKNGSARQCVIQCPRPSSAAGRCHPPGAS